MRYESGAAPAVRIFDRLRPFWPLARPHGRVAALSVLGWSLVVPLAAWIGRRFDSLKDKNWELLLILGFGSILLICAVHFAHSLYQMKRNQKSQVVAAASGRCDALDVCGLSLIVGNRVDEDAWDAMRKSELQDTWKESRQFSSDLSCGPTRSGLPFDGIYKSIAPSMPTQWHVPVLTWPPHPKPMEQLNMSAYALRWKDYKHLFQDRQVSSACQDSMLESVFTMFDDDQELLALLLVSSDGVRCNSYAANEVAQNASAMLLVNSSRVEALRVALVSESTINIEAAPTGEEALLVPPPTVIAASIGRGNEHKPWSVRDLEELRSMPRKAGISRPVTWAAEAEDDSEAGPDDLKEIFSNVSGAPASDAIASILIDLPKDQSSRAILRAISELPSGSDTYVSELSSISGKFGSGRSLASLAYAVYEAVNKGRTLLVTGDAHVARLAVIDPIRERAATGA